MNTSRVLILFGSQEARAQAKGLLENHPRIRRIDSQGNLSSLRLFLSDSITDLEILGIIKDSGLNAVSIR